MCEMTVAFVSIFCDFPRKPDTFCAKKQYIYDSSPDKRDCVLVLIILLKCQDGSYLIDKCQLPRNIYNIT